MNETDAHVWFEELAAGYALSALEPADELEFVGHLAGCARCQQLLAEFSDVAADLAVVSAVETAPAHLWDNIRAAAGIDASPVSAADASVAPSPPRQSPAVVTALHARRPRPKVAALTAVAAATALVLGIGGWVVATQSRNQSPVQAALSSCRSAVDCQVVELRGRGLTSAPAYVLVRGQQVEVVSTDLAAIDTARQRYVLWQMPNNGAPHGVVGFPVSDKSGPFVAVGTLPLPNASTTVFAISLENSLTIPTTPSAPIAVGAPA